MLPALGVQPVRLRAAASDAILARADRCRPCGPSRRSSLPFPQLRRDVVVGVAAVFERAYHARQFRQIPSGGHEMNSSTIVCASTRNEPSRSLALPYRHATPGHVDALALS